MGLFDFLHKPNGKDTKDTIRDVSKIPPVITVERSDGTETTVFRLEVAQKFKHRDGSISCLVKARAVNTRAGDTIFFDTADPICFEVPEGRMDLAKDIIEQNAGVQLNGSSYTYIGRVFEKGDVRLQPPSAVINNEIGKLNEQLLEEITNKRLEESRKAAERAKQEAIKIENEMQELDRRQEERRIELQNRIDNPFVKGGLGGAMGEYYDGINLNNGEILRIRDVKKIAKDATGTYVYTARLDSTPNEDDVEFFDVDTRVPVVFSLPFKLNDIVNSEYDEAYKSQLERGLLQMLSNGYRKGVTPEGLLDVDILHDIGGIDKNGQIISNNRDNVTMPIINKIAQLKAQYAVERQSSKSNRPGVNRDSSYGDR